MSRYRKKDPNSLMINKDSLSDKDPLVSSFLETESLEKEKTYTVSVLCSESFKDDSLFFTNFVNKQSQTIINDKIIRVMKLDGTSCKVSDLPFEKDKPMKITSSNTYDRVKAIIEHYITDIFEEGDEDGLQKCWIKDRAFGTRQKENGNWLRIFYRISTDDEYIEIVLIDPNHLMAIDYFVEKYPQYKTYSIDIHRLYKEYEEAGLLAFVI